MAAVNSVIITPVLPDTAPGRENRLQFPATTEALLLLRQRDKVSLHECRPVLYSASYPFIRQYNLGVN